MYFGLILESFWLQDQILNIHYIFQQIFLSHNSSKEGFPSSFGTPSWNLTCFLVGVSAAGLSESHQGSEVGPQHRPAEGRHGVDAHQATDEAVFAALEQGHDIGTHVVRVLLPEVLQETGTADSALFIHDKIKVKIRLQFLFSSDLNILIISNTFASLLLVCVMEKLFPGN